MNGPIGSGSFSNIAKESLQQYFHSQFVKAIDQRSQMGSETAPATSNGVPKCKNYCHYYKGSFTNYVDKIVPIIHHLTTPLLTFVKKFIY